MGGERESESERVWEVERESSGCLQSAEAILRSDHLDLPRAKQGEY